MEELDGNVKKELSESNKLGPSEILNAAKRLNQPQVTISPNVKTKLGEKNERYRLETEVWWQEYEAMSSEQKEELRARFSSNRGRGRATLSKVPEPNSSCAILDENQPRNTSSDNSAPPSSEITKMATKACVAKEDSKSIKSGISSNETAKQPTQQNSDRKVRGEIQQSTDTSETSKKGVLSKYFGPQTTDWSLHVSAKKPLRQNNGNNRLDSQGIKKEIQRTIDDAPKEQKPIIDDLRTANVPSKSTAPIVDPSEEELPVNDSPKETRKPNCNEPNKNEEKSLWYVLENLKIQLTPKNNC